MIPMIIKIWFGNLLKITFSPKSTEHVEMV